MTYTDSRALRALIIAAAATAAGAAAAQTVERPDITGVWQTYTGAPQAHASGFGGTREGLPGSYPLEFIQKPDQLTIIFESNNEVRRIYIGFGGLSPEKGERQ